MTNVNATLANDTILPKTHRHYRFGSFEERLRHFCMLFEIEPPEIVYEEGEPTLTDTMSEWIKAHEVNMDWLFVGSPCAMLLRWAKDSTHERKFIEAQRELEPEVRAGMLSVVTHTIKL